jgi:hypothetical protein
VSHEKARVQSEWPTHLFHDHGGEGSYYALSQLAFCRLAVEWNGDFGGSVFRPVDCGLRVFAGQPDSLLFGGRRRTVRVWSAPVRGGEARLAFDAPPGAWGSLSIAEKAAEPLLFANWEAAHSPAEAYRVELNKGQRTRLTSFNVATAESFDWSPLREFWFTNKAGRAIHSFPRFAAGVQ